MAEERRALVTNVQGFSTEDGPGIRSTVFFKGCPLTCPWCHNPEGLIARPELIFHAEKCIGCKECEKVCPHGAPVPGGPGSESCESCMKCAEACPAAARRVMGEWYTAGRLAELVLRDRVYFETSGGGVTASGGEAMLWAEFVRDFFARLKEERVHTALDTSGAIGGDPLARVIEVTDLFLLDLKIMDPEKHLAVIGKELMPILHNLQTIAATGKPIMVRVPVVPGYTDSEQNLIAIADFVATLSGVIQVDLLPYHRLGEPKYRHLGRPYLLSDTRPPTDEKMDRVREIFEARSIKAIIAGRE